MKRFTRTSLATAVGLAFLGLAQVTEAQTFTWTTVVNNKVTIPACAEPTETRLFNSYSQPSVNEAGLVVFRARSKGSDGGGGEGEEASTLAAPTGDTGAPARGVYSRDMAKNNKRVTVVTCVRSPVPGPNNLYSAADNRSGDVLGTFNEFPAFPRMDATSSSIASRGQSTPVWEYVTGYDDEGNELTTRVGTSGVYVKYKNKLMMGASLLGGVRDFESNDVVFPEFSVPGVGIPDGTKFDQFPGSPTITDETFVAFKGNFSVPDEADATKLVGKTGVFFRDLGDKNGVTHLVANSFTLIPNGDGIITFGSTAPPSAAGGYVFFVGVDDEESPEFGGIYRALMDPDADPDDPSVDYGDGYLEPLVEIGQTEVPGETEGTVFNKLGEGLSVSKDGSLVAFWGAWGTEMQKVTLRCSPDGNKARQVECMLQSPLKEGKTDPKRDTPENHTGVVSRWVPKNQGIFVYDVSNGGYWQIAKTSPIGFSDFLYWVFSGAPPGVGGGHEGEGGSEDREPPRWRSSAFAAVSVVDAINYAVAFKGTTIKNEGTIDEKNVSGIFLSVNAGSPTTVVQQGDPGESVDPLDAPDGSVITALGIERDGFRGANLAITASMLNTTTTLSMSGIYLTKVLP